MSLCQPFLSRCQLSPGRKLSSYELLQFRRVGKGCLSYMIISDAKAIVIDPTIDVSAYQETAKQKGAAIVKVIDTHTQATLRKALPFC